MQESQPTSEVVPLLDAQGTVRAMFAAVEDGDIEAFSRCWAEDAIWQNMPAGTVRGREGILKWWMPFLKKPGIFHVDYVHIASAGHVVLTERIDSVNLRLLKIRAPVSGVFEVRDGQIRANREYWAVLSLLRNTTLRLFTGRH